MHYTFDSPVSPDSEDPPFRGLTSFLLRGTSSFQELLVSQQLGRHFDRHVFWVFLSL